MNTIARFVLLALVLMLGACAAIPSVPGGRLEPEERQFDSRYAIWVNGARGSVWARVRTLDPNSRLVASLIGACEKGRNVEVLVWAGYEAQAQALSRTCLKLWVTNHPDVARLPDTLLVDSDTLVIYGNLDEVRGARSRNEYAVQAHVKRTQAHRIN